MTLTRGFTRGKDSIRLGHREPRQLTTVRNGSGCGGACEGRSATCRASPDHPSAEPIASSNDKAPCSLHAPPTARRRNIVARKLAREISADGRRSEREKAVRSRCERKPRRQRAGDERGTTMQTTRGASGPSSRRLPVSQCVSDSARQPAPPSCSHGHRRWSDRDG